MTEARTCKHDGCGTHLSRYRPDDDYCTRHAGPSPDFYESLFPSWTRDAACGGMDTAIFDVELPSNMRMTQPVIRAKRVCADCPVWDHCLSYAFSFDTHFAAVVFGGLTGRERMAISNDPERMTLAQGIRLHQRIAFPLAPTSADGEVA